MLSLRIDLNSPRPTAEAENRLIRFGNGYIQAFQSPILHFSCETIDGATFIWVGEEEDPFTGVRNGEERLAAYTASCAGEGVAVHVRPDGDGSSVVVSRTYSGTCPLFVSTCQKQLFVSWRYEEVVAGLKCPAPNVSACKIFLEHGATWIRDQVVEGTYNLWPGEQLIFDCDGLAFRDAPERPIPGPTPIRESARVCEAFFELVKDELSRYAKRAERPLVEVSGGLDSSTLAVAAGAVFRKVSSYGLIQLGVVGEQQQRRRLELVELARLRDFEYPSSDIPPFQGLEMEESSLVAFDDNHRASCAAATDAHPDSPFDLLVAGIGGDELMMEHTYTRQEWELPGTVCTSSVVAGCARADMFLRRGIWPINPFCSLQLIDFCRSLPVEFRRNRLLVKMNLARLGLSDGFLFPRLVEHYGAGMRHEMAFLDVDKLFSNSLVAAYEMIGLGGLIDEARKAHDHGFSYQLIGKLWNIAKLDKVLARYLS